ncbi:MAG TPA: lysylphosphatidylglycerol synthase transmembrane domain-containing protein [Rugosimonospora sp.]|nr:lysylphosphatidylglycerol synthase transmembrane domain-containing protein [Rugosimonospora sp.]
MRGFLRKLLLAALALGALAALAYLSRRKIHLGDFTWSRFIHAVGQANVWLLLLSVLAIYGAYALRSLRWQQLSRYLGPSGFVDVYSATVMGFASIFILGRAGEPVRPLLLARKSRLPVVSMFGVWVLERITDFAGGVALAALSLLVFAGKLADAGLNTDWVENARAGGWLLLAILAAIVIVMFYFRLHGAGALERRLDYWHRAGGLKGWLAGIIAGFSEGLQAIRTASDLLIAVAYTAAHWGLVTLAYLWIARAFASAFVQSDVNFPGAMLLLAVTLVGSVLQLPGVGGGAQVASFIALTTIFGVEQEPAAAIAIVLWLITFAASTLVGVPLLIHEGLSMGELRNLARDEAAAERAGKHVSLTRLAGGGSAGESGERG